MAMQTEYVPLPLERLRDTAHLMKDEGWRFIQTCAANGESGVDLYYSFMKNGAIRNYRIEGVTKDQQVPSITDMFLAAFVFENEARELFGVDMRDIAIDFGGGLYAPAVTEPMTIISPERKAAIDKARKAAAAKAANASGGDAGEKAASSGQGMAARPALSPEKLAKLEERLKDMPPEKVAKVRAALAAREAQAASANAPAPASEDPKASRAEERTLEPEAAKAVGKTSSNAPEHADVRDSELERALSLMDPEKAARAKAALGGASPEVAAAEATETGSSSSPAATSGDAELEAKLASMGPEKADAIRRALEKRAVTKAGE